MSASSFFLFAPILLFVLPAIIEGQAVAALEINADQAQVKENGVLADGLWKLTDDAEWGEYVRLKTGGAYQLEFEASGQTTTGVWPWISLKLDGVIVSSIEVNSANLKVYSFPLNTPEGLHRITLQYLRDYKTGRTLYLKRMTLVPEDGQDDPTIENVQTARAEWPLLWEQQQRQALLDAAKAIEANRKEDATVVVTNSTGLPLPDVKVDVRLVHNEFLFGCNIFGFDHFSSPAENETYKERFAELFNFATLGFYWSAFEPVKGQPVFAYNDQVVAWCKDHDIALKGHPLLWGNPYGIAPWITGLPSPFEQRDHITQVVSHYRGEIERWEVVNEVAHYPWFPFDDAYRWAHEIDPGAQLIINDCGIFSGGCPQFYEVLQGAVERGVPFGGIGIQAHEPENMWFPYTSIQRILNNYDALGKDLYITEFTPESSGAPARDNPLPNAIWDEQMQAEYAVGFYTMCFANPAVKGITWWDLCDRGSWRKSGGLLRADLSPKPAYLALQKLIRETWSTHLAGTTDANGRYSFRGFRGTYLVTINDNGFNGAQKFYLTKGGSKTIQIALK